MFRVLGVDTHDPIYIVEAAGYRAEKLSYLELHARMGWINLECSRVGECRTGQNNKKNYADIKPGEIALIAARV